MGSESKRDLFQPPPVGLSVLEAVLPPSVADYELGDLEEEYRWRARRDGLRSARRWFWAQVCRSLWVVLKEGEVGARLAIQVVKLYRLNVPYSMQGTSFNRFALIGGMLLLIILLWVGISEIYKRTLDSRAAELALLKEEYQRSRELRRSELKLAEMAESLKRAEESLERLRARRDKVELELSNLNTPVIRAAYRVQLKKRYRTTSLQDDYTQAFGESSDALAEGHSRSKRACEGDVVEDRTTDLLTPE